MHAQPLTELQGKAMGKMKRLVCVFGDTHEMWLADPRTGRPIENFAMPHDGTNKRIDYCDAVLAERARSNPSLTLWDDERPDEIPPCFSEE